MNSNPDETIDVEYQEICSNTGWCVVKIVPRVHEPPPYQYGVSMIPSPQLPTPASPEKPPRRQRIIPRTATAKRNGITVRPRDSPPLNNQDANDRIKNILDSVTSTS